MSKDFENNDMNKEPNNFGLPEGYFEKSAGSIFNKIEWMEEHKEFPQLAQLKKDTGFIVPGNYFEELENDLELLPYPNLSVQNKEPGFIVPEKYFEQLRVNELSKVLLDEENELQQFPFLNTVQKLNAFTVDENYFKDSEQKIISALSANADAKIIKLFSLKTWYTSAAAILTITFGLWLYNHYFKIETVKDCGTLACIDKADLLKAKMQVLESIDDEELNNLVDTKKLEEKLEKKEAKDSDDKNDSLKNSETEELIDNVY